MRTAFEAAKLTGSSGVDRGLARCGSVSCREAAMGRATKSSASSSIEKATVSVPTVVLPTWTTPAYVHGLGSLDMRNNLGVTNVLNADELETCRLPRRQLANDPPRRAAMVQGRRSERLQSAAMVHFRRNRAAEKGVVSVGGAESCRKSTSQRNGRFLGIEGHSS
jgi:hypothetical protein